MERGWPRMTWCEVDDGRVVGCAPHWGWASGAEGHCGSLWYSVPTGPQGVWEPRCGLGGRGVWERLRVAYKELTVPLHSADSSLSPLGSKR